MERIKKWKGWDIWTNWEGWKYITVNLIGNLFPVWFLLIIEFGNNGLNKSGVITTISQPYTYLILSVAFASSTLYLWIKNLKSEVQNESSKKNKISIGMIFYVLILFPVIGFYLSKKECLETYQNNNANLDCYRIVPVIYVLFLIVVLAYIYFQLKDFDELRRLNQSSKTNVPAKVDNEIKKLNEEL
jgi:hypothetical protein